MKKQTLIIITYLILFSFHHTIVSAKTSYFDKGKKLFDNKNYKDSKLKKT